MRLKLTVLTYESSTNLEVSTGSAKKDSILQAGNPVKEILLKLNLPDHRILKDGGEGVATETKREDCVKLIQEFDDIDISESMVTWETEGDKNMKLFHGMVNQRRRNQYVQGILINGVWISDPQHVKAAFLEFYHDKFKAQTTRVNFGNHLAFKSLSPSERISLEA
ncbi:hypothetical protein Tco_0912916 [Tanacetum coccineum]